MFILRIFALVLVSISMSDTFAAVVSKEATYYADSFEGARTANGDVFSHSGFTAAACGIPLGKNVYVSSNDVGALIRINDRPNCSRFPNIIDLSKSSFSLFAPLSAGRIHSVDLDTLDILDVSLFRNLGVELSPGMPSVYFAGDGTEIRGRVLDGKKFILVFLQNQDTQEVSSRLFPVNSAGLFSQGFTLPNLPGKYSLVVASGNSFRTTTFATIRLVSRATYTVGEYEASPLITITPRIEKEGKFPRITLGEGLYGKIELRQDTKKSELYGTNLVFDTPLPFRTGIAQIAITGNTIGSGGPLDKTSGVGLLFSGRVILDRTHESIGKNLVTLRNNKQSTTLKFKVPNTPKIRGTYYLTFPNGDVREFDYLKTVIAEDGFLIPGKIITLILPTTDIGTYMVEAVRSDGTAYFNFPIQRGSVWNIIQPYPPQNGVSLQASYTGVILPVVKSINTLRAGLGRPLLLIDPEYSKLAQAKVDDMIQRQYHAHQDPDGLSIGSLAQKIGLDMQKSYRENIAYDRGDVNSTVLQDGLEESGSHRFAMLIPGYTKIGVGYGRNGDQTYLVHIIGE